jgi:hypothetical protein
LRAWKTCRRARNASSEEGDVVHVE